VDRIEIFHSDRSVARFDKRKIKKIEKVIIEASKQCINPFFPEFEINNSLNDNTGSFDLILDPSGSQPRNVMESLSKNTSVRIIVGPEGGFNQTELDELGKSGHFMSLGKRILRVETSVIVSLAYVNLAFNRL
jgi:16S rRNA (uracil1498-N3)-methyltransferase